MQLPSHDILFPNDKPSQPATAAIIPARQSPMQVPSQLQDADNYVYTRGKELILPAQFRSARMETANQLSRVLGGQAEISDQALGFAFGVAGTAFSCAETRANITSSIPLYVGDMHQNPIEDDQDNPLHWFTTIQAPVTLYHAVLSYLIWGRVYLRKLRNERQYPTGLEFINPADVIYEHVNRETGFVESYDVLDPVTFKVDQLKSSEVIYIQAFDPDSGGQGLARFEVAWRELHIQLGINIFASSFFLNHASPDGVLMFEQETNPEMLKLAREQWEAQFKSVRKSHRTAVLPMGMKWMPIQAAPRDLAMVELDERTTNRIHAIFQVHPALTGSEDVGDPLSANSTFTAIEVNHLRSIAIPMLKLFILPALNGQWAHVDFDLQNYFTLYIDEANIPALADANLTRIDGAKNAKDAHLLEYDEARELFGYEPREKGEYFIRSIAEAMSAFAGGAITHNELQWYTRGLKVDDPNGDVVVIGGMLLPAKRMLELANLNVERMKGQPTVFNGLGGNPGISVTKPPDPQLPPSTPDPQPEERTAADSICIAFGFANHPDLLGLQQRLRQVFEGQDVTWRPGEDLHSTLLYAPSVDDEKARQIVSLVRAIAIDDDLKLRIGSLNTFDRLGEYSLHFLIRRNEALLRLQERLYAFAQWAEIALSSYSVPQSYEPHVTMGTLKTKPSRITFDPKLSITPASIWVYRGDEVIYERTLQKPLLPERSEIRSYIGAPTTGTPGASVILKFADVSELVSHQTAIQYMVGESVQEGDTGVRWTPPDGLHVTLLSAVLVDDEQLAESLREIERESIAEAKFIPGMVLSAGPLSAFEQDDYNVLILPIESESLTALQKLVYEKFASRNIPVSAYALPEKFTAHVTIGYLPKHIPVPTAEQVFNLTPSMVIASRESFETVYSLPFAVDDRPSHLARSRSQEPLSLVIGFAENHAVRMARRELDAYFVDLDYANPRWIPESEWALELVALDEWTPGEAAKLLRQADFDGARKFDLWTNGYVIEDDTIYLRVQGTEALEALRTSVAVDAGVTGRTPQIPSTIGIPLCVCIDTPDIDDAPDVHYPLVAGNVTLRLGRSDQHQWMLRGVPRQRAEELNNWRKIARRHGGDYAFRTEALRSTEEERFIRAALDAEVEVEEVFDLADALLRGEWTFRSYADTRDGFVDAIRDLFVDGQSSEITRRKFSAQLRAYLREYGLVAYRDGMNASGYDPESFSQKEVEVFRAWQEQQSQYVTGLGAELFGPGVSEAVIEDRVRMWADISLREINLHGVAAGDAGKRYRWEHESGADHCEDCPQLDGQVHTIEDWLNAGLYPGSGRTKCKQGCRCGLVPTDEETRGDFLRSAPERDSHFGFEGYEIIETERFDPSQPRDPDGQFSETGGGSSGSGDSDGGSDNDSSSDTDTAEAAKPSDGGAASGTTAQQDAVDNRQYRDFSVYPESMVSDAFQSSVPTPTETQADAIDYYRTNQGAESVNRALRTGEDLNPTDQKHVEALDAVLGESTLPHDAMLYRGIAPFSPQLRVFTEQIESGSLKPGAVIRDNGFASTTLDPGVANSTFASGGGVLFEIKAPAGSRGMYINSAMDKSYGGRYPSEFRDEKEVLLPRGTAFRVTDIQHDGNQYRVSVTLDSEAA